MNLVSHTSEGGSEIVEFHVGIFCSPDTRLDREAEPSCMKSESRYPPYSDFLKLSKHIRSLVNLYEPKVQHFPVEITFYLLQVI